MLKEQWLGDKTKQVFTKKARDEKAKDNFSLDLKPSNIKKKKVRFELIGKAKKLAN